MRLHCFQESRIPPIFFSCCTITVLGSSITKRSLQKCKRKSNAFQKSLLVVLTLHQSSQQGMSKLRNTIWKRNAHDACTFTCAYTLECSCSPRTFWHWCSAGASWRTHRRIQTVIPSGRTPDTATWKRQNSHRVRRPSRTWNKPMISCCWTSPPSLAGPAIRRGSPIP